MQICFGLEVIVIDSVKGFLSVIVMQPTWEIWGLFILTDLTSIVKIGKEQILHQLRNKDLIIFRSVIIHGMQQKEHQKLFYEN